MITSQQYIEQTEDALLAFFEGVQKYQKMFEDTMSPVAVLRYGREEDFDAAYNKWRQQPEIEEEFQAAHVARERLDGSLFSMQVIAGSILHIAYQAIKLYANPSRVQKNILHLFEGLNPDQKISHTFACGRLTKGVPIGLAIFAGRNQHHHIDAGTNLSRLNRNIFAALANYEHGETGWVNPAFNLENDHLHSYAANIVHAIEWRCYDDYFKDMQGLVAHA